MLDDDVAAALCAVTAFADVAAFKSTKELFALCDVYVLLLPQCERTDRRGGIMPAVFAMAITRLQRVAAHLNLYRATVTLTSMRIGHACLIWHKPERVYKILLLANRSIGAS